MPPVLLVVTLLAETLPLSPVLPLAVTLLPVPLLPGIRLSHRARDLVLLPLPPVLSPAVTLPPVRLSLSLSLC